ncbi:MAG: hypothetical protein IJJ44_12620 [Solobacterium sp.]|nr:hypothetical protein [Solobacterium sp.]
MKMQDLKKCSKEELDRMYFTMTCNGEFAYARAVFEFKKFYGKKVVVVRGRKVAHDTVGTCFWMGMSDYSKHGDLDGTKSVTKIGIKGNDGNVYWTYLRNVELYAKN